MKKLVVMLFTVILLLSACSKNSDTASKEETADKSKGKSVIMTVGYGVPENHFEHAAMVKFKEYVEANSNITVKLEHSNKIGADKDMLDKIQINMAQMNLPGVGLLGNIVPEFNLLTLPYIFDSQKIVNEVVDGPVGQELLDKLEAKGYVGLGFGDFGYRNVSNNKKPITTLNDIKGLKIRTMATEIPQKFFNSCGALATPMASNEVFTALSNGNIDGQENPIQNIYSNKFYEVQKYISMTHHEYTLVVFVVGKKWYDQRTEDEKKVLQEAANIAKDYMRQAVNDADAEARKKIEEYGKTQFNELTPEGKAEFKAVAKIVNDEYGAKINQDLYDRLLAEIEKAAK
ncbi:TRAP transporter substrate-binding protein [Sebaldella sp. S0638]|uniref:TRAP transporter substrate-binding protein n=1 Tax=Sebaldella sp. S0638 TaxID=2957809 RepID=UPI0020A0A05D|nr:TRAP transporter substrate-binding protein [Sebaldella sp. S0638]MCP1223591.1 TRAP transporter substrate-binding protein [Sebaldella sp. S0638]